MKNVPMIFAAGALGVAVLALTREPEAQQQRGSDETARIAELERKVEALTYELDSVKSREPAAKPPRRTVLGLGDAAEPTVDGETRALPSEGGEADPELTAMVDDAVERKTKQVLDELRIKANKKPGIEVFAKMLELSKSQRAETERIVADGQRKVHELLNVPTANGTNLMDELVEIVARGFAEPGKDHGFQRWVRRIMSEKVPGTDQTYAARLEAVKNDMRARFRREWTKEQYREFEEWKVDPTEIQNVKDSPNVALMERIFDRARTLGAEIPQQK